MSSKYLKYAVYPDGKKYLINKKHGYYWYTSSAGSNTMEGVKESVEYLGGKIVKELNPHYTEKPLGSFIKL